MIAIIPFVFVVIGLLMFALSKNPKLVEIGRIVFAAAFLVLMFASDTRVVKLFAP